MPSSRFRMPDTEVLLRHVSGVRSSRVRCSPHYVAPVTFGEFAVHRSCISMPTILAWTILLILQPGSPSPRCKRIERSVLRHIARNGHALHGRHHHRAQLGHRCRERKRRVRVRFRWCRSSASDVRDLFACIANIRRRKSQALHDLATIGCCRGVRANAFHAVRPEGPPPRFRPRPGYHFASSDHRARLCDLYRGIVTIGERADAPPDLRIGGLHCSQLLRPVIAKTARGIR